MAAAAAAAAEGNCGSPGVGSSVPGARKTLVVFLRFFHLARRFWNQTCRGHGEGGTRGRGGGHGQAPSATPAPTGRTRRGARGRGAPAPRRRPRGRDGGAGSGVGVPASPVGGLAAPRGHHSPRRRGSASRSLPRLPARSSPRCPLLALPGPVPGRCRSLRGPGPTGCPATGRLMKRPGFWGAPGLNAPVPGASCLQPPSLGRRRGTGRRARPPPERENNNNNSDAKRKLTTGPRLPPWRGRASAPWEATPGRQQGGTPGRAPRAQPLGFGCFSTTGFGVSGRFARGSDGFVDRAAALPKAAGCLLRGWGKKNIRKNKKGIRSKSGGALLSPDLQEFLV